LFYSSHIQNLSRLKSHQMPEYFSKVFQTLVYPDLIL
jgi:hypothetical protein